MSIILDGTTRVVVQGITGRAGRYHTRQMLEYGTKIVGGSSPRASHGPVEGVPVFPTLEKAVRATGGDLVLSLVPALGVGRACEEAMAAGAKAVVVLAEHVPLHDALRARDAASRMGCRLIGPNTNGIMSPGKAKVGFFPAELARQGQVGIVSRSGTLAYGASVELLARGLGQSTVIGIGGGKSRGTGFVECLELFFDDPETGAVLLLGEIGGGQEQAAAAFLSTHRPKPVVAYLAGRTAPPRVAMGHAGALVQVDEETVAAKERALVGAGALVARTLGQAADLLCDQLRGNR